MLKRLLLALLIGSFGVATVPASATTVVIYQDPMTMDRRTVVVDDKKPDRAYWCVLPPSSVGCRELPVRRGR
ncbi:hypothetical protein H8M03_05040 [Sphingomonas sabuli]|uniref:Uncharacterized protein n=1 Tax=Sphingomonas sabuli TaxID=2764186 RepID=A0A7G9L4Z1_9SPHN|nr:hypothetical protein [Sphingomonas sabuli]QNM83690.1 hypothetical protein H8M03_05040 [Sphingomonas sabuli]